MDKHNSTPKRPITKDLTGQKFGRLTVISYAGKRGFRHYWNCQCQCGNRIEVRGDSLSTKVDGEKSCGCYNRERASTQMHDRLQDLTGQRFGRYTVIGYAGNRGHKHYWKSRCDCGNVKDVRADQLKDSRTVSCGCYNAEIAGKNGREKWTTHGMSKSHIYGIWSSMKARCENKNSDAYPYYGGRGIKVCKRWRDSFEAFYQDMGEPPTPQHSLDRIDNDGNYEPSNCRWATKSEQRINSRPKGTAF